MTSSGTSAMRRMVSWLAIVKTGVDMEDAGRPEGRTKVARAGRTAAATNGARTKKGRRGKRRPSGPSNERRGGLRLQLVLLRHELGHQLLAGRGLGLTNGAGLVVARAHAEARAAAAAQR